MSLKLKSVLLFFFLILTCFLLPRPFGNIIYQENLETRKEHICCPGCHIRNVVIFQVFSIEGINRVFSIECLSSGFQSIV